MNTKPTIGTDASACPHCKAPLEHHLLYGIDQERPPHSGDATCCIGCGAILEFGPGMELLPATHQTIEKLSPASLKALQATRVILAKRGCLHGAWVDSRSGAICICLPQVLEDVGI